MGDVAVGGENGVCTVVHEGLQSSVAAVYGDGGVQGVGDGSLFEMGDGYVSSESDKDDAEEDAVPLKCPICLVRDVGYVLGRVVWVVCCTCCESPPTCTPSQHTYPHTTQNWLYHPIGLSCGHTFCERCLLTSAHLDHMLGPFGSIMRRAPSDAHCPECRQTGVFENAMKLRELDELVRLKYVCGGGGGGSGCVVTRWWEVKMHFSRYTLYVCVCMCLAWHVPAQYLHPTLSIPPPPHRYPEEWRQQAAEARTRKQRMLRRFLRQRIQRRTLCGFSDQDGLQRTSVLLEQVSSILTVGSPRSV